jgi:hypothetical protein
MSAIANIKALTGPNSGVTTAAPFLAAKTGPAKVEAVMGTKVTVYTFAWYAVPAWHARL